ncbi:tRNA1(Val) (adenine(37)-N6)-methyltransferase [Pedobacter cryophilus]|uniref:tRNA1(Val) (adenine(37)-N6)-methyltransferase n=1 Tax=Pedobacter cryophilus TaxID=2571271 RepID=A0A4U1BZP5_9SPHI|nr:methyltransferase [Pedobacter cryophilus]TKB96057.1 methyltransferase domain-containing protein [Pedobacter cryophilus]
MSVFRFKEFEIDQENCPMKINTDGVLLGAMADVLHAKEILDIGTGTGIIALMLAQRNLEATINALDIDFNAFVKAEFNFRNSLFHERLTALHTGFKEYFDLNPLKKYDLIVSNPPYFLHSLQSPKAEKNISRHTDEQFFLDLLRIAQYHLSDNGTLELIVPVDISLMLQNLASDFKLHVKKCIKIRSYEDKATIRHIISFSKQELPEVCFHDFCIYEGQGVHSLAYKTVLKDFFIIF